jgi:hypothetical protein
MDWQRPFLEQVCPAWVFEHHQGEEGQQELCSHMTLVDLLCHMRNIALHNMFLGHLFLVLHQATALASLDLPQMRVECCTPVLVVVVGVVETRWQRMREARTRGVRVPKTTRKEEGGELQAQSTINTISSACNSPGVHLVGGRISVLAADAPHKSLPLLLLFLRQRSLALQQRQQLQPRHPLSLLHSSNSKTRDVENAAVEVDKYRLRLQMQHLFLLLVLLLLPLL